MQLITETQGLVVKAMKNKTDENVQLQLQETYLKLKEVVGKQKGDRD